MMRKLTISVDDEIYKGLYATIGRRKISRFLSDLARPHVSPQAIDDRAKRLAYLEEGYKAQAADEAEEKEAFEWIEATIGDAFDED
jgi:hypothetical protein